jgi:hypothetical protein
VSAPHLNIIEFAPYPDSANREERAWSLLGHRSLLVPNELSREIPPKAADTFTVEDIGVTEDNLVLFFVRPLFQVVTYIYSLKVFSPGK